MPPDLRACLDSALSTLVLEDAEGGVTWAGMRAILLEALLPTLEAREQALREKLAALEREIDAAL